METTNSKYERAAYRVSEIRKFYGKTAKFALFLAAIAVLCYVTGWMRSWVYIVLGFWAFGLMVNAFQLFGPNLIFGADWERRMIAREMDKEDNNTYFS